MTFRCLASPHGARICTSRHCTFLVWAVAASGSLRSFLPEGQHPPWVFPAHASCTRWSAPFNFLTSYSDLPLSSLTWSAGTLDSFTTNSRTLSLTPKKEHTLTPFSLAANCSRAMGKAGGEDPKIFDPPQGPPAGYPSLGLPGGPSGIEAGQDTHPLPTLLGAEVQSEIRPRKHAQTR